MKRSALSAVVLFASLVQVVAAEVIDLAGAWHLASSTNPALSCAIAVPGDVHTALFAAKLMPDPYWGCNETNVQWVAKEDWVLSRAFDVSPAFAAKRRVVLEIEDADTFADIYLNGTKVGETSDRFARWTFDAKGALKAGRNEIKAVFRSAWLEADRRAAKLGRKFPMSNVPWAKNQALIRKPACHAGWDWGLAQMITGFCGETKILAYDDCKVDYVYSTQEFNSDFTHCDLTVFADAADAEGQTFTVTNRFTIENPPLWWPNGAGEQKFYTYTIKVDSQAITRKIGLRKIEVLNTPDKDENGKPGARMAFRVNGRELFMKGANWIPCSAFENEQTAERYRDLLESAASANMNMIRVWGGGQYEKDCFYEICDELGILLWHDLMFSCAVYPGDERFLGSVREELKHQIRRLRDHASIAMWCGDNECVGALNWFGETKNDKPYYKKLLEARHAVSDEAVTKYDPQRAFWPSSPCAGPGNYANNWKNDSQGDMHNWTVWHENASFDAYYRFRPRFCSEFGYQSFSSREVAETYCNTFQLNPTAPDFEWHQKNPGGNQRMLETMARYFRFPQGTDAMLYLSQVQQSIAIKTAVEGWRAQRPRCMGTLFWQLNDNWPVASWSSVEYGGKWKHLQYHARRFFAPLAVVGVPAGKGTQGTMVDGGGKTVSVGGGSGTAAVKVLNDLPESVDAEVTAEFWGFDGRVLRTKTEKVALAPDSVTDWGGGVLAAADAGAPAFLILTLRTKHGDFRNDWMFGYYKAYDLADANVTAAFDGFKVTLSTDRPAFFVWANARGIRGEFSDNSFTLLPGRPVTLTFAPKGSVSPEAFRRAFSVTHLRKTY